jgi:class 3 adenylate cyclase
VACFDLANFGSTAWSSTVEEVAAQHHHYVTVVHQSITGLYGLMDKVIGDRIFGTWNAPRKCARAEFYAVRCAMKVVEEFGISVDVDELGRAEMPNIRVGIANSAMICGNMGSDSVRMFISVGDAVGHTAILQKAACKEMRMPILFTDQIAKQVECNILCLPVTALRLPKCVLPCYRPVRAHETGGDDDQEWMYRLRSHGVPSEEQIQQQFALYCRGVKSGQAYVAPREGTSDPEWDRHFASMTQRFPLGIQIPYMF